MYGVALKVWGPLACFTRPEMKVERVSYDVMTPSAARGILEAIYWKPAIVWRIDRIHVLKPIRFVNIMRNEVGCKMPHTSPGLLVEDERQQRSSLMLRDVAYIIEAHFELTPLAGKDDPHDKEPEKHREIFMRRAQKGQCYHRPYLGTRECVADFEWMEPPFPPTELPEEDRNKDLGWMLYDIDFEHDMQPLFFRARLQDGVLHVPPMEEVVR